MPSRFILPSSKSAWKTRLLAGFLSLCAGVFFLGFDWGDFSLKRKKRALFRIQTQWTADTVGKGLLRPGLEHNIPPLPVGDLVIQGNMLNGVQAYNKNTGRLVWAFTARPGVAGPLLAHKNQVYFGGADGFFYSLQQDTGQLNWKFWTGSENASAPLIHDGKIYWTANNHKLYALSLEGKSLWMYSGPPVPTGFVTRGRPRPAQAGHLIYTAFQGVLFAIHKDSGKQIFKRELSPFHNIVSDIERDGSCLFVPVFDFYLFCLRPSDGTGLWRVRGGGASSLTERSVTYQFYKGELSALKKFDGKALWRKKTEDKAPPLPPVRFKNYVVYGFPSKGKLVFALAETGKTAGEWFFGRGLSAPVVPDPQDDSALYVFSIDGILHKITVTAFVAPPSTHAALSFEGI